MGDDDFVIIPRWALEEINILALSGVMRVPTRNPKRREEIDKALAAVDDALHSEGPEAALMDEVRGVLLAARALAHDVESILPLGTGCDHPATNCSLTCNAHGCVKRHQEKISALLDKIGGGE
jgi:hypothetical protein